MPARAPRRSDAIEVKGGYHCAAKRIATRMLLLTLFACNGPDKKDTDTVPDPESPLIGVPSTESWTLPGLHAPAYVLRTEGNVPYLYAEDAEDLARLQGFV